MLPCAEAGPESYERWSVGAGGGGDGQTVG
jgi:hypothetical protein